MRTDRISCQGGCVIRKRYIPAIPLSSLSFSVCIEIFAKHVHWHSYSSSSPFCICTLCCNVLRKHMQMIAYVVLSVFFPGRVHGEKEPCFFSMTGEIPNLPLI